MANQQMPIRPHDDILTFYFNCMNLTGSKATFGLQTTFVPTNTNVSGQIQIGKANQTIKLTNSDTAYSLQAFFKGLNSQFTLDYSSGTASYVTTWVAGTAQVETATASGTATESGDVTITITAIAFDGPPKAIAVPITSGDTASVWAGKVRTALAADTDVAAFFSVSGTSTSIVLTRKLITTINGSNISVPFYYGNDSTLNIGIDAGSTGVTDAPTSTNTTAGIPTSGCLVLDGDGKDIEGNSIVPMSIDAAMYNVIGDEDVQIDDSAGVKFTIKGNGSVLMYKPKFGPNHSFISQSQNPTSIQFTAIGG